jgi:hypothetical protein
LRRLAGGPPRATGFERWTCQACGLRIARTTLCRVARLAALCPAGAGLDTKGAAGGAVTPSASQGQAAGAMRPAVMFARPGSRDADVLLENGLLERSGLTVRPREADGRAGHRGGLEDARPDLRDEPLAARESACASSSMGSPAGETGVAVERAMFNNDSPGAAASARREDRSGDLAVEVAHKPFILAQPAAFPDRPADGPSTPLWKRKPMRQTRIERIEVAGLRCVSHAGSGPTEAYCGVGVVGRTRGWLPLVVAPGASGGLALEKDRTDASSSAWVSRGTRRPLKSGRTNPS